MYRSVIGKPSLRVGLLMGLLIGLSLLLLTACGGQDSAKGGAGQEHKSATGGSAATNGQIALRRWLDEIHAASFTMNLDGSHVSQITYPPKGFLDDFPEWSPDGNRLAFLRDAIDGSGSRIMILNTDTGNKHQVTQCTGRCQADYDPAWAPDGRSLAFRRVINPDSPSRLEAIWIGGFDGSDPHQVTDVDPKVPAKVNDWWPQFSPDGKKLAFDRIRFGTPSLDYDDERHAVFVQRIDSSGSPQDGQQLTPWSLNCGITPHWSPDGTLVLFRCGP
jgi:Tol biopolymer transport system component